MNRKYEIGFIINPEAMEDEVKKIVDSVTAIIEKGEGIIENVDEWGRKKLAYPIEKHTEGFYIFINTEMKGALFFDIERRLKLTEKVMRFVVLRLDDKLKKANKLTKKWKRTEKLTRKSADERDNRDNRGNRNRSDNRDRTERRPDRTDNRDRTENRPERTDNRERTENRPAPTAEPKKIVKEVANAE
ncbi:MAG: 30S ribosomal protein S6 [bacterium]|nr:30S ribosomal protein S6 [bacterium]